MVIDCAIVKRWQWTTVVGLMSLVMLSVLGACASDAPKPSAADPGPSAQPCRSGVRQAQAGGARASCPAASATVVGPIP